jgi:hypothetical protein
MYPLLMRSAYIDLPAITCHHRQRVAMIDMSVCDNNDVRGEKIWNVDSSIKNNANSFTEK